MQDGARAGWPRQTLPSRTPHRTGFDATGLGADLGNAGWERDDVVVLFIGRFFIVISDCGIIRDRDRDPANIRHVTADGRGHCRRPS